MFNTKLIGAIVKYSSSAGGDLKTQYVVCEASYDPIEQIFHDAKRFVSTEFFKVISEEQDKVVVQTIEYIDANKVPMSELTLEQMKRIYIYWHKNDVTHFFY
jgi:hypothetical protein